MERLGEVRCASCRVRYTSSAIRGVGYEDDRWFAYVTCLSCGRQGVAIRRGQAQPSLATGPQEWALGTDDVPDAHEMLRRYSGDVHGLFSAARERRAAA